jgi:hypothetical protein
VYKLEKTKLNVRIELQGETLRQFKTIKQYYGLVRNSEVLHLLITQKYEEFKQLQVSAETFQKLEQKAKGLGLTVSQYVAQLVVESQKKE